MASASLLHIKFFAFLLRKKRLYDMEYFLLSKVNTDLILRIQAIRYRHPSYFILSSFTKI